MGLLNKVKNIFFEEVEVEEEVSEPKEKKEKPVAKKIELPKAESRSVEKKVEDDIFDLVEEDVSKKLEEEQEREKRISMDFDEDDFKVDEKTREYVEMAPVSRREKERKYEAVEEEKEVPVEEHTVVVEKEVIVEEEQPKYEEVNGKSKEEPHGLYEGRQEKKKFTPTPVISPVYGILDKNYKKEDVVSKREIRLSTPSNKKLDLDTIREKAYGDLSIDISNSMEEVVKEEPTTEVTEDTVYDLNTNTSPEVEKVTIGDADEYYNELGLEYNVDYKDNSTKTTKRRSSPEPVEENVEVIDSESKEDKHEDTEELESNLFDLVDSMYEDKE